MLHYKHIYVSQGEISVSTIKVVDDQGEVCSIRVSFHGKRLTLNFSFRWLYLKIFNISNVHPLISLLGLNSPVIRCKYI